MKASNSLRHGLCRSTIRRRIFGNTVDHFASCSLDKKRDLVYFRWGMEKFTSDCDLGPSDDGFRPVSCRVFYSWCLTRSTLAYEVGPNNQSINQCQKLWQRICQKDGQKICQKECQKICQKECQKICQKECQKICQKECQKICQKECQKVCQKIHQKECQKE